MDLRQAIDDCIAIGTLTPEFVDHVWRIGITLARNAEWLRRIDWEGSIQDTLIEYLDLDTLPFGYEKPNHAIAARLKYNFRHACWKEKVKIGGDNPQPARGLS